MRSGLFLPPFDELADPALVARLAAEAEERGWDGVFVWDHVRWGEPVLDVADPQITLAAVAALDDAHPARADGHPPRATPACQGGPGDGDARPAQRGPADAWRRARRRCVRERVLDDRRGARRPQAGRDAAEPYDIIAALPPGSDPAPYAAKGATWWLVELDAESVSVDRLRGVIRDGPAPP